MESDSTPVKVARWSKRAQLWIKAYPEKPVFASEVLDGLQGLIGDTLSLWSRGLRVAKNADARSASSVGSTNLHQAVHLEAPPRRGLGSVVLRGAYKGVRIYLDSWEGTVPPELNAVSVEVVGIQAIEGQLPPVWSYSFFRALVAALPVRYANARLSEEFSAKNMIDDETGLRAVGVNLTESLPGLYWLNYFGKPYLDLVGEQRLLSSPAQFAQKIRSGVLLVLGESPFDWQSESYKERERAVLRHVGQDFFFSRSDPARQLVAPTFL